MKIVIDNLLQSREGSKILENCNYILFYGDYVETSPYLLIEYFEEFNVFYISAEFGKSDDTYVYIDNVDRLNTILFKLFTGNTQQLKDIQKDNAKNYYNSIDYEKLTGYFYTRNFVNPDEIHTIKSDGILFFEEKESNMEDSIFTPDVEKYLTDMVAIAKNGEYTNVIGRDNEIAEVVKSLSRFKKGNPMLVGESGVGKSSILEGLAQMLAEGSEKLPEHLKNFRLYELEVGKLMAGAKYRGDLEKRVTDIFTEVNDLGNVIVFIDEIHGIKGKEESSLDIGNLLKTYLTKSNVRVVGATTYKEFKRFIEKDPALPRRFQKVEVTEPSVSDCYKILEGVKSSYEDYHGVTFSNEVVRYIVDKGAHFVTKGFMPDKVLDVMDLVGTEVKINNKQEVTYRDVNKVISEVARIPLDSLQDTGNVLKNLKERLNSNVFGQEHVTEVIEKLVKVSKMGLGDKNKPMASLLFTGSSGTGKTELCKNLSSTLGLPLCKFDMSEYSDKTAVNKLVGSNSGYVGYEEGGLLTETVMKNPSSVVLLDEIEKAHTSVYTLLLQVMDEGKLTDNQGRVADFKNVIFVMTSNTGAAAVQEVKTTMGFLDTSSQDKEIVLDEALKEEFPPEFRNRLDAVCRFNNLTTDTLQSITNKFVKQVEALVKEQGYDVEFSFTKSANTYFVENGFEEGMGARPMSRLVKEKLKLPLSDLLLDGKLVRGTKNEIKVGISKGEPELTIQKLELA